MKKRFENFKNEYDFFEDRVRKIVELKRKIENVSGGYIDSVDFESGEVEVSYYIPSGCGCCPGDTVTYYIKTEEVLMDLDDYEKKVLKEIKDKNERIKREFEETTRKQKEKEEKEEKEYYNKLKQKYE